MVSMSPSDKTRPNLALLEGLISELGISPAWLLTGEGPMFAAGEDATPFNDVTDPVHQAAM